MLRPCLSLRNCTRSEAFGSYASSADAILGLHKTPGFSVAVFNLTIYGPSGSTFFNEWKTAYQEMNLIIRDTLLNPHIGIEIANSNGKVVYSNKISIEEVQTLPNANTKPEVMSAINNIQGNSDILRFGYFPLGTTDLIINGFGVASTVIAKKETNSKSRFFDIQSVAHSYPLGPLVFQDLPQQFEQLLQSQQIPFLRSPSLSLLGSLNLYTITASQERPIIFT